MLFASACGNSGDPTETSDPRPTDTRVDDSEDSTGSADTADDSGDPTDAGVETDAATDTDGTESTDADAGNEDDEPVDDRENLWDRRNEFVAIEGVPGVSDDEISVAVVGIREFNPLGTCILDCYLTGVQAYFDYVNDGGGIYGRDLVIGETHDDQLLLNQQAALEIISDNKSFASFQATLNASGWGDLHEAGIPSFTWNIHSTESADRDTIFGSGSRHVTQQALG